jgi:hypothetical protein
MEKIVYIKWYYTMVDLMANYATFRDILAVEEVRVF